MKTEQDPAIAIGKTSLVDVLCKDEKDNTYIVEMQVAKTKGFEKRAQYYAAKAYISQMNSGDKYENLKEVIFIAITDYVMFPEKLDYKSDHVVLDKKTLDHDLKGFSFTFLELPKFNKKKDELNTMIEKWCYFFRYAPATSDEDLELIIGNDHILEKAYKVLEYFNMNKDDHSAYEQALKIDMDNVAVMDAALDDAMEKGIRLLRKLLFF